MNRRRILQALTAGVAGMGGCIGLGRDQPENDVTEQPDVASDVGTRERSWPASDEGGDSRETGFDIEFDRVVNAVEDLGMDPTGERPIDDAFWGAYETGTLLQFPPGDYAITEEAPVNPSLEPSRFGIVGLGDSHTDVQFHFPAADGEDGFWFIHQSGGTDCVLANFSIQVTNDSTTMANVRFDCADGALVEDVEWLGFIPGAEHSYGQVLSCNVNVGGGGTVEGVNTIRRVRMGRGGAYLAPHSYHTGEPPGLTGIRVYPQHVGELVVEDVHIEQMGANAIRSTTSPGIITIRGGLFKNNHYSNIRVQDGHHPTKTTTVTGATVVLDQANPERPTGGTEFYHASGIIVDSTVGGAGAVFEDCDIVCNSITGESLWGLIRCTDTGHSNPGGFTMRNCRIVNDTQLQTLWVQRLKTGAGNPKAVTLEDTTIRVSARSQDRGSVISVGEGWEEVKLKGCTIRLENGGIHGPIIDSSSHLTIEGFSVEVDGLRGL